MNIVGLGKIGSAIAEKFSKHKQYSIFKISSAIETSDNTFFLEERANVESYDSTPINPNFDIQSNIDLFLCGEEAISAASLRILENYKDNTIRIFYLKPNYKFLSESQKLTDKTVCGVLQEYARSKKFDSMYILDQESISKIMGKVPITSFYDKLYEVISSTIHMINVLENSEPAMTNIQDSPDTYCINTVGVMNLVDGEENLFYSLDFIRESRYYYCINKDQLNTDGDLLGLINDQIDSKIEENVNIMFGVYPINYKENYCYVICKSPYTQK